MFFELRQYKTRPGKRDAWVKTMEKRRSSRSTPPTAWSYPAASPAGTTPTPRCGCGRFDSPEQKDAFAKTIAESDYWKTRGGPGHPGDAGPRWPWW